MDKHQVEKTQREVLRWRILQTLNISAPYDLGEDILMQVAGSDRPLTQFDIRRQLDYLETRGLLTTSNRESPTWDAKLTRHGVDLVEYEIDCEPGIARPRKYW